MPQDATEATTTVTVLLAPALKALFPGAVSPVDVSASTVSEMLDALDRRWPGMRDRVCDSRPAIRRHMNVFVEGERARLDSALPPRAEVYILTAMSGG